MQDKNIDRDNLGKFILKLKELNLSVVAPKREGLLTFFGEISSLDEYDESTLKTERSIKELFLPRTEKVAGYRFQADGAIAVDEPKQSAAKTVIIGARPCDAAALAITDHVFSWDYQDNLYQERRKNSTIITMACDRADEFCMCTTVGCSPTSESGSDLLFIKCADGSWNVRVITEKGEKLISEAPEFFSDTTSKDVNTFSGPKVKADIAKIKPWLDENFEDSIWDEPGLRCLGCGTCAYVCPTCHCFDIIDEGTLKGGKRVRNWDSCGFGLFTLHASGHNPRSTQDRRYRQRIMHKFKYYMDKFGATLCTGCGRCTKSCPVDIDLAKMLELIAKKQAEK